MSEDAPAARLVQIERLGSQKLCVSPLEQRNAKAAPSEIRRSLPGPFPCLPSWRGPEDWAAVWRRADRAWRAMPRFDDRPAIRLPSADRAGRTRLPHNDRPAVRLPSAHCAGRTRLPHNDRPAIRLPSAHHAGRTRLSHDDRPAVRLPSAHCAGRARLPHDDRPAVRLPSAHCAGRARLPHDDRPAVRLPSAHRPRRAGLALDDRQRRNRKRRREFPSDASPPPLGCARRAGAGRAVPNAAAGTGGDASRSLRIRSLPSRTTNAARCDLRAQATLAICGGGVIGRTSRRRRRLPRDANRPAGLFAGRDDAARRFALRLRLPRWRLAPFAARLIDRRGGTATGHLAPFEDAASGLLDRRRRRLLQVRCDLSFKPHHDLIAGRKPAIFDAAGEDIALLRA